MVSPTATTRYGSLPARTGAFFFNGSPVYPIASGRCNRLIAFSTEILLRHWASSKSRSGSPLKLIEEHFGLKPLTTRDGAANDMQDCFDFNQSPLPPRVISRETQLDFSDVNTTMP
jgi:hypothetical protein